MSHVFTSSFAASLAHRLNRLPSHIRYGRVVGVTGLLLEIEGLTDLLAVGDRCRLIDRDGERTLAEVTGFHAGHSLLDAIWRPARIGPGCRAELGGDDDAVYPCEDWLGRVVGALGEPVDGLGPLSIGPRRYPLRNARRRPTLASVFRESSTSACARSTLS